MEEYKEMRLSGWHVMEKTNKDRCYYYGDMSGIDMSGLTDVLEDDWRDIDYAEILSKMYEDIGWVEQVKLPFDILEAMKNSNIMETQRKTTLKRLIVKIEV